MIAARGLRIVPHSIRGRLLVGVVLLVTVGLVGSDVALYTMLRSYFAGQAERRLTGTAERIERVLHRRDDARAVQSAVQVLGQDHVEAALVDSTGRVITSRTLDDPRHDFLIRTLDASTVARLSRSPGRSERLEVASNPYRTVYHRLTGTVRTEDGTPTPLGGVIVAVSLSGGEQTLHQVAVSEAIVTLVALSALIALGSGVLRVGLRPLRHMAATATAIAGGDRTRQLVAGHPHTEAGRLAAALNQAFERQRHAEDRLRRFVADVSHELRTPLSTIGGWADLYFQGGLPDRDATTTAMSRIADQAAGMRRLVEDLLLLARLDRQRTPRMVPVELTALVDEIVSDARVIDPDRPITLAAPSGTPVTVTGDAERLRQLLRNLLGNALQHTPSGTPVHVSVQTRDDSGSAPVVCLAVTDQGPGVPVRDRPHLFERFYQGDPVRRRGSGLGLSIARAIVEAHGGAIELRTPRHGSGSEFSITLPVSAS